MGRRGRCLVGPHAAIGWATGPARPQFPAGSGRVGGGARLGPRGAELGSDAVAQPRPITGAAAAVATEHGSSDPRPPPGPLPRPPWPTPALLRPPRPRPGKPSSHTRGRRSWQVGARARRPPTPTPTPPRFRVAPDTGFAVLPGGVRPPARVPGAPGQDRGRGVGPAPRRRAKSGRGQGAPVGRGRGLSLVPVRPCRRPGGRHRNLHHLPHRVREDAAAAGRALAPAALPGHR